MLTGGRGNMRRNKGRDADRADTATDRGPHKLPLPIIFLSNSRSPAIRRMSWSISWQLVRFEEIWLHSTIPDMAIELAGCTAHRCDRSHDSGKNTKGDSVSMWTTIGAQTPRLLTDTAQPTSNLSPLDAGPCTFLVSLPLPWWLLYTSQPVLTPVISLFADDLLLYISDTTLSILWILFGFQRFGSFSGYRVNFAKSESYSINAAAVKLFPVKLSPSGFKSRDQCNQVLKLSFII